jgi:hypothetical protein
MLKENAGLYYSVEFTACCGWFEQFKNLHSLRNLKVSGLSVSADAKDAEEFLETLDKLILRKITCQRKSSMWMKPPYSGNGCLKTLSSIRRPSQCQVSRLLRTG